MTNRRWASLAALLACGLLLFAAGDTAAGRSRSKRAQIGAASSCVTCHAGIEDMHPEADLTCVDCHGGDPSARSKRDAHVAEPSQKLSDERVAPRSRQLAWRRFLNPMDLRVTERTCGACHEDTVEHVAASLHATTAGHLSDGFYEMGLSEEKGSRYAVFEQVGAPIAGGACERLLQVPAFDSKGATDELGTHYTDLARKECMQCHLWSKGRAVRGRVGFDGDYRGAGCAACHVSYAMDGLSQSADEKARRFEPGHALTHEMTRAPTTQTCVSCHYGDASIGLHFRGLSQLPPGAPGGPEIQGATDALMNRSFYLNDPAIVPPDVHHERGMHCIDCHTASDVMGDGRLHGQMEHAVEISCEACHGTFDRPTDLTTERGTPLEHLHRTGDDVVLISKVDGKRHPVPQVVHVLDPMRPEFNPRAVDAMTSEHGRLECYTCHAGWNANFLGFHFARNASLTQLDLLSGRRSPGQVTTQEKVFATWKSFYAGFNEAGRIAPYLTGFSTMGSVRDEKGELILDQVMPETAAGLSGMTMVHHQLHSNRPTARSCVECHRSASTWGLGSPNFRLARQLAFVAERRGIEVVALDRANLSASVPLAKFVLPDVVDLELDCDPIQGHAKVLYASEGGRGLHVIDVSDPVRPRRLAFQPTVEPRDIYLMGRYLLLADGIAGLRIFETSEPGELREVGRVPTLDAHAIEVHWPWAFVADGAGGLVVVDVRTPIAPEVVCAVDLNGADRAFNDATNVKVLFQYSRPLVDGGKPRDRRSAARLTCFVQDQNAGLVTLDVTDPTRPSVMFPQPDPRSSATGALRRTWRGLVVQSHVDIAERQGGTRTQERDYVYQLLETRLANGESRSNLVVTDVTDPARPVRVGATAAGYETEHLSLASFYNPPLLQPVLFSSGSEGVYATDVSISRSPTQVGTLPALLEAYAMAVEEFPLDKMVDEDGKRLKDVSHPDSRWMFRSEFERVLTVRADKLGLAPLSGQAPIDPALTARLTLDRQDEDGDGVLRGAELDSAGTAALDKDGDGRVFLYELADKLGLERGGPDVDGRFMTTRVEPDGELAKLLDGTNPFEFDEDEDRTLGEDEWKRALFRALDLDGSDRLTTAELSRYHGAAADQRFEDEIARASFGKLDRNRDGKLSLREFTPDPDDFRAMDIDGDGRVALPGKLPEVLEQRGFLGEGGEWPRRRRNASLLEPSAEADKVLARFDFDGDQKLSRRELKGRPGLLEELDLNRDGFATSDEVRVRVNRVSRYGVDALADDFVDRWDLDGDGVVEADEVPRSAALRLRLPLE